MFKNIVIVSVLGMMLLNSGCASYLSYKASKNEIAQNRIAALNDKDAIKAINMGVAPVDAIRAVRLDNNGVGIGVDISNLDALTQHPLRQLGSALLDAALTYGAVQGIQSATAGGNNSSRNTSNSINVQNADHTTVTITDSANHSNTSSATDNHSGNGNNR